MEFEKKQMILIVDDNPDDIELTTIALASSEPDLCVRSAQDGGTALRMLRTGGDPPDLILIDIKMPGMSGLETLREIRADRRLKGIPVIMLSSSSLDSDRESSLRAGASGFLHKSLSFSRFSNDLDKVLHEWLPGHA